MPKGSSKTRRPERAARGENRTRNRQKGEETPRVRRAQQASRQKAPQRERTSKGEEPRPFEHAQALVVRAPAYAMRAVERQTELMQGESTLLEHQSRKTFMEAIDQAQRLAGQAQQVGACSIRASASLAQDWLTLTWHMWDTATETMRHFMRGEASALQREGEQPRE